MAKCKALTASAVKGLKYLLTFLIKRCCNCFVAVITCRRVRLGRVCRNRGRRGRHGRRLISTPNERHLHWNRSRRFSGRHSAHRRHQRRRRCPSEAQEVQRQWSKSVQVRLCKRQSASLHRRPFTDPAARSCQARSCLLHLNL